MHNRQLGNLLDAQRKRARLCRAHDVFSQNRQDPTEYMDKTQFPYVGSLRSGTICMAVTAISGERIMPPMPQTL